MLINLFTNEFIGAFVNESLYIFNINININITINYNE